MAMTEVICSRRAVVVGGGATLALGSLAAPTNVPLEARGTVFHNRSGATVRRSIDPGIAGVLVSNGKDVVRTDAEGRWRLPVDAGARIFVIKPPGWALPAGSLGRPRFWGDCTIPSEARSSPPIDFALFASNEGEDFDVALVADTQPQSMRELDHFRDTVLAAIARSGAAFAINHGDVVADDLSLYPRYLQLVAATGMPWHHCPGNHDMNGVEDDNGDCFETWKSVLGPCHYALQHGRATFILLNNVERLRGGARTASGYGYRGAIGRRQLEFVRNILRHVPPDHLVVVSMHIPLVGFEDPVDAAGTTADRHELMSLLSGRPHTVSFSGHTHTTEHHYLGHADGFAGPGEHHHHVLTAASGSWWSGPYGHDGLPFALSRDGTPKGFHVMSVRGNSYATRLVSLDDLNGTGVRIGVMIGGNAQADRFNTRSHMSLSARDLERANVVANVFDGGPRTSVRFDLARVGERGLAPVAQSLAMTRQRMPDPFTADLYLRSKALLKPWVEAAPCSHMWQAPLPANLEPGIYRGSLIITDEYARRASTTVIIEVAAD